MGSQAAKTFVIVDSHIQRIVLVTEETTVTQEVSNRPVKCESRLWSQRGTKVNGSHHGDNALFRPTGIQSATKVMRLYEEWHRPISKRFIKPPYSISIVTSIDSDCCCLPTASVLSNRADKLRSLSVLINESKFLKATHRTQIRKIEIPGVHGGGGLELMKPAREPASSRPKSCASLKKPRKSCPFAAPYDPRRKEKDCGQTSAFPSETSRFAPLTLAHRGSALPWFVDDRATLCLRRIRCVPTQQSATSLSTTVLPASRVPPHLP